MQAPAGSAGDPSSWVGCDIIFSIADSGTRVAVTSDVFSLLFVIALLSGLALRTWLATRQMKHVRAHRGQVPPAFAADIPLSAHQRAADYTVARVRLALADTYVGAAVLVGFTLLGGAQWLYEAAASWLPQQPLLAQLAFLVAVVGISALLDVPFAWWRQFRLERRFGFNRMTPALFFADLLRGGLIALLVGAPLGLLVLWLMRESGSLWWLWVWGVWVVFNLLVVVIYPTLIAPRFNRFEPLPEGELRDRVEALLARCGFTAKGLFVMDGSRRSSHGNAYFTGFGRAKRIVFFDTLLERLEADEIEAVLAHELGHFRHRHILRRIVLSFAASFVGLAALGWLSAQTWFYQGLGMSPGTIGFEAPALILFMLVLPVFLFPLRPLGSFLSRRDEFQADAFAARETRAGDLVAALVKLYKDNASTLTPDPLHSAFYDSHPPAAQRVGRLLALARPPRKVHP